MPGCACSLKGSVMPVFHPRDYHSRALAALEAAERDGLRRMLVAHATGLGKTLLFAWWLQKREGRAIVLAHRDELIRQARRKLRLVLGKHADIGIVKGTRNDTDAQIIVASVQSLHSARLARIKDVRSIVVDEAHHAQAASYQRILKALGGLDGVPMLGVTATPFRGDHKPLGETFEKIVDHMSIKDGIASGYLCNLRALRITTKAQLSGLKVTRGDVNQAQAGHALMEAHAPETIARAIVEHCEGRPTLVFCPTIEVSREVAREVRKLGRRARHIDGETDPEIRKSVPDRLERGHVITNCGVFTEGFDCPVVSAVVIARPTRSENLYIQMVGRGTRTHPDKADCLILDVVGATMRHDLCTSAILELGISEEEQYRVARAKEIAKEAERRNMPDWLRDIWLKGEAKRNERPQLQAVAVDLWSSRPFAWVKTFAGYILDVGASGRLLLAHDGAWKVIKETRDGERTTLFKDADLGYAQGWAEDWVREHGKTELCRKDAAWRQEPITEGQKYMLGRWRVPWTDQMSRGEASDAIARALANARRS